MSPAQQVAMARTAERSVTAGSPGSVIMCMGSVSVDPGPGVSTVSWNVPRGDTGSTARPAVTATPSTASGVTRSPGCASVGTAGGDTSATPSVRRGGGGRTAASTVGVEEAPVITRLDSAPAGQDIRGIPAQTLVWMDISASTVSSNAQCATRVG